MKDLCQHRRANGMPSFIEHESADGMLALRICMRCMKSTNSADGPEVELIRMFARFPNGTRSGFKFWRKFAERINPNAGSTNTVAGSTETLSRHTMSGVLPGPDYECPGLISRGERRSVLSWLRGKAKGN